MNVDKELAALERQTIDQLRAKFAEVFGEPTNSRHKQWLIKRIIWRMQANAEGGLSERARQRAMELATDATVRMTPPRPPKAAPDATARTKTVATTVRTNVELLPDMSLERQYKGRTIVVKVLADGFEFEGERYASLTAVAKAVTGKHWNGFHFFGLRKAGGSQ